MNDSSTVVCRIQLLGPPGIWTSAGHLSAARPFVFGAALYLCVHRGHAVPRTELATLLWPDADGASRGERMRWLMRQLRQGGIPTALRTPQIELARAQVELDIDEMESAASMPGALDLVRGDILAGYEPEVSDGFSRWLDGTRDVVRSRVIRALDPWLAAARGEARWSAVEDVSRRMLSIDTLHEGASLALAEALAMQGRVDRAAQVLAQFRTDSGSTAPSPALRSVQRRLNALVNTSGAGRQTQIVGREAAFARLLQRLETPRSSPQCIGIAGPSGIGKSRLLRELATAGALRGIRVAFLTCSRADALRPISLVADLARALLAMRGALGAAPESIAVLQRLLGSLTVGIPDEAPDTRRAAVFAALSDLIGALIEDGPVTVIADDVQWAEPGSWSILAPLIDRHAGMSWLLGLRCESADAASETFRELTGDGHAPPIELQQEWLDPLGRTDVATLCTARAMPRRIPAEMMDVLVDRAAGIPFVAEALVEHWCETGDAVSLPESVTRLVSARLDRLSPSAMRVVEAIAVLGADADAPGAEAVTALDRSALLVGTRELDASGILRTTDDGMLSVHALWTEAVLGRIPPSALRLQHRYAAEWLEHVAGMRSGANHRRHWTIASHWLAAGDPERARRALDSAADALLAAGFVMQAGHMLERAGDIAGASDAALHYWDRAVQCFALEHSGEASAAVRRIHERYDRIARALQGTAYTPHHNVEYEALVVIDRAYAGRDDLIPRITACVLADEAPVLHRLNAAWWFFEMFASHMSDRASAERVWRAVSDLAPTNALERLRYEMTASTYHSRVATDSARGLSHALKARTTVEEDASFPAREHFRVSAILADAYEFHGDLDSAQDVRRQAVARAQVKRSITYLHYCLSSLVGTALEAGRPDEARPLLPLFDRPQDSLYMNIDRAGSICRVVCSLEEGDVERARAELDFPLAAADEPVGLMPQARVLAIYAHLALLEQDDATIRALLPRLLGCFDGLQTYMDHPAYVAGLCLERLQGPSAAGAFVEHFLRFQRPERWTPRAELVRLAGLALQSAD